METNFDCAGICDPSDYFTFTDVNRGEPSNKEGCFKEIYKLAIIVEPFGKTFSVIMFFALLGTMI